MPIDVCGGDDLCGVACTCIHLRMYPAGCCPQPTDDSTGSNFVNFETYGVWGSKALGMGHELAMDRCRLTECTAGMSECADASTKKATAILMEFPDSHFRHVVITCGLVGVVNRAGSNLCVVCRPFIQLCVLERFGDWMRECVNRSPLFVRACLCFCVPLLLPLQCVVCRTYIPT